MAIVLHRSRKMKGTQFPSLHRNTFLVFLLIHLSIFPSYSAISIKEKEAQLQQVIGYGYSIKSVATDYSTGNSLFANLQLINNSSVFGTDIHNLILIARLFFYTFFFISERNCHVIETLHCSSKKLKAQSCYCKILSRDRLL